MKDQDYNKIMVHMRRGRIPKGWTGTMYCPHCICVPCPEALNHHVWDLSTGPCPWCLVSKEARYSVKCEMSLRPEYSPLKDPGSDRAFAVAITVATNGCIDLEGNYIPSGQKRELTESEKFWRDL